MIRRYWHRLLVFLGIRKESRTLREFLEFWEEIGHQEIAPPADFIATAQSRADLFQRLIQDTDDRADEDRRAEVRRAFFKCST